MSMEPWPLDSTKRSRSGHCGLRGLWRRCLPHKATAISAMPIGAPGWPELACCTASIARARMALAMRVVEAVRVSGEARAAAMGVPEGGWRGENPAFYGCDAGRVLTARPGP